MTPGSRRRPARHRSRTAALAAGLSLVLLAWGRQDGHLPRAGTHAGPGAAVAVGRSAGAPRKRPASEAPITLAFAGDVHFEGSARAALSGGLAAIGPTLSRADLTMVNLETAVTAGGNREPTKAFTFRAPPSAFSTLKGAGVDVVTMANNHGLDYGQVGLADSLAASRKAGLPVVGAGMDEDAAYAPYITSVKGRRVAFLGATQVLDDNLVTAWSAAPGKPGLASAKNEDRLTTAVRSARARSDVVVVDLHWGTELMGCPTDRQRRLAATLAAAGADVVVGSHAHILLGGGWLNGAYVDYGLGNFVFYAQTELTEQSGVLVLTLRGREVRTAQWLPAHIESGLPRPLTGPEATSAGASWKALRGCTGLSPTP